MICQVMFYEKMEKKNEMSPAAVVMCALRVDSLSSFQVTICHHYRYQYAIISC